MVGGPDLSFADHLCRATEKSSNNDLFKKLDNTVTLGYDSLFHVFMSSAKSIVNQLTLQNP